MTLVYVDNVHKAFGELEVLKGINLSVAQGEVVAIIGRSGSGKSTLLRCLNQLENMIAARSPLPISSSMRRRCRPKS